ncbi:MAG: FapA family protein [Planctomycetota bacterium]
MTAMSDQIDNSIRVSISGDGMTATLRIEPGTAESDATAMVIQSVAHGRGLLINDSLERAIQKAADDYDHESPTAFEQAIAHGTPPRHGDDGRLEFDDAVTEVLERKAKLKRRRPSLSDEGAAAAEPIEGDACHYERSTIAAVKEGDRIGRLIHPTAGSDGTDVCGTCVPAKHGALASVVVDAATIRQDEDGTLTARVSGLLDTADDRLRITHDLVIPSDVDFSTGNVEFDGNITIERGVKDCFVVESTGSIRVVGQVEAATLRSKRDTALVRGMTGRDKGQINAARDVQARFIDSATVTAGRDLRIEREMTHCHVRIGRDVIAPEAVLLGGECTVGGAVELAQLGSESNTPTLLRLGSWPDIDRLLRDAVEIYPEVQKRAADAQEQLDVLQANTAKLTATQAESMTALQFIVMNAEAKLNPLRNGVGTALELFETSAAPALTVHRRILPGVDIAIGGKIARITDEIQGPVRITLDEERQPVIIEIASGSATPLSTRAAMDIDHDAIDPGEVRQRLGLAA